MQNRLFGTFSIYGLLIAAAVALGVFLCVQREKEMDLPKDISLDLALWAVPLGIIGARLYYVIFQWEMYRDDPVRALYIWEGGLAIYGGVIGGAIGVWLLARRRKVSFLRLADLVAPSLILAQAIGRWGNFFNGEAYGRLIEDPALRFFPIAVQVAGQWHMATFFYESVWDLAGFFLLWKKRNAMGRDGNLFLLYLVWYGLGRAVIEGLRTDSLMLGNVRVSQALSVVLCVTAAILLYIRRKKDAQSAAS